MGQPAQDNQDVPDIETEARMILSAVARMEGEWGAHKIAAVLCGGDEDWMKEDGLDELSVHGLLSHHAKLKVIAMIGALVDQDLVNRGAKKTLELTPEGGAVMTGDHDLSGEARKLLGKARNAMGMQ